jgi:hypothetical protein
MTDYDIVDDIAVASHWIAYPDEDSMIKEWIIPGKKYELIKIMEQWDSGLEEEYFILSEDGCHSMYYMTHNGDFIIMKEN